MGLDDSLAHGIRTLVAALRHNSRRVARIATRFNRAGLYVWDIIVWSRIAAARTGWVSLDLPAGLLALKGVAGAPPALQVRTEDGRFEAFNDGFAAVNAILFANLQMPDVLSAHRYGLPGPAFRGVYLWDSAFIAQVWAPWDRAVAAEVLRAVVALRDGPRLQHVVADFVQSAFTQPPLVAWSLGQLLADEAGESGDRLAAEFHAPLVAYHHWLVRHRRRPDGLFAWQHPYESGIDNSPRFSNRDESRFEETTRLSAPDFSTYMVLHAEALAVVARRLGHEAEAQAFEREAAAIRDALNRHLWHEEDGCYYDRNTATGAWRRTRTIASLLPLWAGVPDAARAMRLRDQAMDPRRFGTMIPLPSVARDDPAFELDMWRGPVWVNTAYGVLLGLERHGFLREAAELAWRLCAGVYSVFKHERQLYEFYDPDRARTADLARKSGNRWKQLTLGSGPQREFVGWSGLVNTLVIKSLFGFAREHGRRCVRPAFPPAAVGAVVRLTLPAEHLTIEVVIESAERVQGWVQGTTTLRTFTAAFGERIGLDALLTKPAGAVSPD